MSLFLDSQVGFGIETTFGTPVARSRFLEFVAENIQLSKQIKQGTGLRVGSRVERSARRVQVGYDATGDVEVEAFSKGQGLWWQLLMGAGTSTLVSTGLYQQVFTFADVMPNATVQVGRPRIDGTVDAYTFAGVSCASFDIAFAQSDIVKVKATLDCRSQSTATALDAASYPTGGNLFHFAGFTISSGTFTAPTATALASAATPMANVQGGNITVSHNLNGGRYLGGSGGLKAKQLVNGVRNITGTLTVEYADSTLSQAIINETPLSLVGTWTNGTDVLQVAIPEVKLDGDLPVTNGGQLITHPVKIVGLDNLTAAQPMWIVCRTADAAL